MGENIIKIYEKSFRENAELPALTDYGANNTMTYADFATNIAAGDLQLFKDKAKYNISEIASLRTVLAQINMNEGKPLHDPKVRAALIQCLDR